MRIDGHAHLVPTEEGLAQILRYMREADLDAVAVVPGGMINPRGMASFLRGTESLQLQEAPNDFLLEAAGRHPGVLLPFVQIDPRIHDAEFVLDSVRRGAV